MLKIADKIINTFLVIIIVSLHIITIILRTNSAPQKETFNIFYIVNMIFCGIISFLLMIYFANVLNSGYNTIFRTFVFIVPLLVFGLSAISIYFSIKAKNDLKNNDLDKFKKTFNNYLFPVYLCQMFFIVLFFAISHNMNWN